jgi:hypothetical protein
MLGWLENDRRAAWRAFGGTIPGDPAALARYGDGVTVFILRINDYRGLRSALQVVRKGRPFALGAYDK